MPTGIVDACCTINLYATGNLLDLLPAMGFEWHIAAAVLHEAMYVRKPDPDDAAKLIPEPIDLKPALDGGLLRACDIAGEAETELFVRLAVELDDGEAMSLAIAKHRGWTLATDDRKARRLAGEIAVPVQTTAELVKAWADATKAPVADIATLLRKIQTFARFIPHKTMPLYQWWMDTVGG